MNIKEKQKLIKIGVFAGLGVLFVLALWLIFQPSAQEQEKELIGLGLNDSVPQATTATLPEDKAKAYQQAWQLEQEGKKKEAINDLANYFDNEVDQSQTRSQSPYMLENKSNNAIDQSVMHYQNANKELANFYNSPPAYDAEKEALKERLQELEEKMEVQQQEEQTKKEQLELMEKSYQMAAQYMPQSGTQKQKSPMEVQGKESTTSTTELPIVPIGKQNKSVVSALVQQVADTTFVKEQLQERNRGFYSLKKAEVNESENKNTLRVCVQQTSLVRDGETVSLRLLEKAKVGNVVIPKNTLLTALAHIQGNRLRLNVGAIAYKEQLIGVKLTAFELDGQEGVFIPNSTEMNAIKEVAANMSSSVGQSFTFSSSAGQQLAGDLGKGILQGTSKYLNKKIRQVKVTLKAGHLLYLVQNN